MPISPLDLMCLSIFEEACKVKVALRVKTNDSFKCRASLWRFRKDFGNPEFENFQIRISPDDTEHEIWIIRQGMGITLDNMDVI